MEKTITDRVVGAARLDVATYEAVERDVNANTQALVVVVLAAIASGIGSLGVDGITSFVTGLIGALVGWIIYSGLAYLIGTRLLATAETRATYGEVLRTLGFAQAPRLLLVLAWIPILGLILAFVVGIWVLVATIIAIRQSMELTTGRAIGTAVIAWIIYIIVNALILGALSF
ncbi:YIP1 family protein [Sphaerobacter sp.]|uniref:YIP1 family protein n=1 Tax=Sphaerobacter sp. TaxID=2099654 RepID=UPI001DD972B5|nr:YIP1 family protein [Sphaerobacter sp.]MBX5444211.1 YIP1 family protein [Sphaerobacter sp.]